jgi:hypothetical protein
MAESTSKSPSPFDPKGLLAVQQRNAEALTTTLTSYTSCAMRRISAEA